MNAARGAWQPAPHPETAHRLAVVPTPADASGAPPAGRDELDLAVDHSELAIELLEARAGDPSSTRERVHLTRLLIEAARVRLSRGAPGDVSRAREQLVAASRLIAELQPALAGSAVTEGVTTSAAVSLVPSVPSLAMRREGGVWFLSAGELSARVKDCRGLQILARLVDRPGVEIAALELAAGPAGSGLIDLGDSGEHLDEHARSAYRRRLRDLEEDLEEALACGDYERLERLEQEKSALVAELSRALGLGGRARRATNAAERARSAVQRRLKDAIARVGAVSPALGAHLARAVRTGARCSYRAARE